jgi:hypothetical protein
MSIQFKPLSSDLYSIPKAQILFKPEGADAFELLGDADEVTVEPTVTETERFTNEAGVRLLAKTIVTQVDAKLVMTLVQLSDRNRALALLGLLDYETQTVQTAHNMALTAVDYSDKIYMLDHIDVTNVVVKDGAELVTLVLGTDYKLDAKAGFVQLINKHAGSDADLSITYDAPAIVTADGVAKIGLASKTENRGTVIIRGTNEVGQQTMLQLHDVQLRPSAARSYISATDFANVKVEGRIFRDENQAAGYELGFERNIPA